MYACLIDKNKIPLTDDQPIQDDSEFEQMIDLARSQDVLCAIKWHRTSDGQVAYWSPGGASLHPHWYNGNKNAQHGDIAATSQLQIRCTPKEKTRWVRAAKGKKLSDWVRDALNAAAREA